MIKRVAGKNEKTIEIAKKYCEQNDKRGHFDIGYNYLLKSHFDGQAKYINERTKFYKKACDLKYSYGCRNLIWTYKKGTSGYKLYKSKACQYGLEGYCD